MSAESKKVFEQAVKNRFASILTPLNPPKVIYISGAVTGLPYHEVYQKFKTAETHWRAKGWEVLNPCDLSTGDADWKEAMRISLAAVTVSDAIYMLPDWTKSRGATMERYTASNLGIEIIEEAAV